MRYSLLSRFKGTLLGMAVGEAYARKHSNISNNSGFRQYALLNHQIDENSPLPLTELACSNGDRLIRGERIELNTDLSPENWRELPEKNIYSALAIAIPIALLAHERKGKLIEQLRLATTYEPALAPFTAEMLGIGYVISQSLREKLLPRQLIPKLCHLIAENSAALSASLSQIDAWLETPMEGNTSSHSDRDRAMIFPLYSFLRTPEDYPLTVSRVFHLNSPLSCAIAGALSGAYNGLGAIPIQWRLWLDPQQEEQIEQLSEELLATWSGVYQPQDRVKIGNSGKLAGSGYTPIAAPQVMSSRRF